MLGYKAIPDEWKGGIPGIADKKFNYTDFTFHTIVDSTEKRTLALIQKTGGRVEGDKIFVNTQPPKAPKLEAWDDYGKPAERIAIDNPRWQWKGAWKLNRQTNVSAEKGAEASIQFQGTGFIVTGPLFRPPAAPPTPTSTANSIKTIDVYPDEDSGKNGESVFHAFHLKKRKPHRAPGRARGTVSRLQGRRGRYHGSRHLPVDHETLPSDAAETALPASGGRPRYPPHRNGGAARNSGAFRRPKPTRQSPPMKIAFMRSATMSSASTTRNPESASPAGNAKTENL